MAYGSSDTPIPVIRIYDPAIDHTNPVVNEAFNTYGLTRDPELIAKICKPGEAPTRFVVRRATRKGVRYIRAGETLDERHERAFAVCVVRVEDRRTPDGRRTTIEIPDGEGARPMPESLLERFDESDIQEIGGVALGLSFLSREMPAYFPPPAISWRALEALMYRRAEPTSDSEPSSPPSSE